jgi:succinate-semialdehyde dehydrogenase/glutarate-semialdehyde dehydrogenase
MDPIETRLYISSEDALLNILDQVKRFEKTGAKILVGGKELQKLALITKLQF